jgi:hypothetical protein
MFFFTFLSKRPKAGGGTWIFVQPFNVDFLVGLHFLYKSYPFQGGLWGRNFSINQRKKKKK